MHERLAELIRRKQNSPEERENLEDLEWLMAKHKIQGAKRANILASILLPEWLQRKQIRYEDIVELDEQTRNILLQQDTNPVAFLDSSLANLNREILDTVKTVVFTDEDLEQPGEMHIQDQREQEMRLPLLQSIDFTKIRIDRGDILTFINNQLASRFPFLGIRRRIILPGGDDIRRMALWRNFIDIRLLKNLDPSHWQIYTDTGVIHGLTDAEAKVLSTIMACKELVCTVTGISDKGIDAISNIEELVGLQMESPMNINDDSLKTLLEKTQLHSLRIANCPEISGRAFNKPQLKLRKLALIGCDITDEGVRQITINCPNLQEFKLDSDQVTSEGIAMLRELQEMTHLVVADCGGLDDEGIRHISELENLEALDISDNIVTDNDLVELSKLKKLKAICLGDCEGMTRKGLEGFKKTLPECEIEDEESIPLED